MFVELAFLVAASEIAGPDFPDQVAACFAVVWRDRTLAGVVVEVAASRSFVQCPDRRRRERAETHGRDVEHAGRIGLRPALAHGQPEVAGFDVGRRQRMVDPFVVDAVDIVQRAERAGVVDRLRPLVDERALLPRERGLDRV